MILPNSPEQLALDIMKRSICSVQVGAALQDIDGRIISWGWNSVGDGFGEHAEAAAIRRANKRRIGYATLYVASQRKRNSKPILSKPCPDCQALLDKYLIDVLYRDAREMWMLI
jgi:deoxycytidylate deaminase